MGFRVTMWSRGRRRQAQVSPLRKACTTGRRPDHGADLGWYLLGDGLRDAIDPRLVRNLNP